MTSWEILLRVGIAAALGILVGTERHIRGHPAGISTHGLVATGAALFTLAGAYGFQDVATGQLRDPARIAAQVASGIGFVGAGAILKEGASIRGLTTAASLWASGSLGVTAAAGSYAIAAVGLGAILAALTIARLTKTVEARVGQTVERLTVHYATGFGTLGPIISAVRTLQGHVVALAVDDSAEAGKHERRLDLEIRLPANQRDHLDELMQVLESRPEIRRIATSVCSG